MLFKIGPRLFIGALLTASLYADLLAPASAAILLGGTRVIVTERDREASISMKNESNAPYVVQAWVDAGEGNNKTPFLVTPPLSRLDPGMQNILRVLRASSALPADRESVFWLNVKEIPEKAQGENVLQIAVRTRIKLFYRPASLRGGDEALAARSLLRWAVVAGSGGKGAALKVFNPTPYHVTFTAFNINDGRQEIVPEMLAPQTGRTYPLTAIGAPQAVSVRFATINDYGGKTPEERVEVPATQEPVALQPQPVQVKAN